MLLIIAITVVIFKYKKREQTMKIFSLAVGLFALFFAAASVSAQTAGWMSRYWDGCKAHCMWSGNTQNCPAGAAKSCNKQNQEIPTDDINTKDACQGGTGYYCWNHAPVAISETEAYGFVARNGGSYSNKCGECYELTFTGSGQHGHSNSLSGKKMTVMLSNVGYDVQENQFDFLVPGGGLGIFDAFSSQLGVSKEALGENHGGFVSTCGHGNVACVVEKCNSVFAGAGREDLRDGCLFYANWLGAANNPNVTWKTVTCPQALLSWYKLGGQRPASGVGNPTPATYTLTVNRNPVDGGTTAPTGAQSGVSEGTAVNITATAATGYTFNNWTISGSGGTIADANAASTSVTVNGNVTVTANFKPNTSVRNAGAAKARGGVTLKPAPGGFTALLPAAHGYKSYKLINVQGREIKSGRIGANTNISVSGLTRGVFFLRLDGNNKASTSLKVVTY